MPSSRGHKSWERVLAAMEADAARAAALLGDDHTDPSGDRADQASLQAAAELVATAHESGRAPGHRPHHSDADEPVGVPATWRLPTNPDTADTELPSVDEMPPIPEALRERIERLRSRIAALQIDLAKALGEARAAASKPAVRIPQQQSPPGFVDRKL